MKRLKDIEKEGANAGENELEDGWVETTKVGGDTQDEAAVDLDAEVI